MKSEYDATSSHLWGWKTCIPTETEIQTRVSVPTVTVEIQENHSGFGNKRGITLCLAQTGSFQRKAWNGISAL